MCTQSRVSRRSPNLRLTYPYPNLWFVFEGISVFGLVQLKSSPSKSEQILTYERIWILCISLANMQGCSKTQRTAIECYCRKAIGNCMKCRWLSYSIVALDRGASSFTTALHIRERYGKYRYTCTVILQSKAFPLDSNILIKICENWRVGRKLLTVS